MKGREERATHPPMNYRHDFHAGNFADLLKHAVLTEILAALTTAGRALTVIDTHAGAGLYDLAGEAALKTGEGAAVRRLMADAGAPPVFNALKALANALGGDLYPGSPLIAARALGPGGRLIACELRADDHARLRAAVPGAQALKEDGWTALERLAPRAPAALLVLIDPPFERGDDYGMAVKAAGRVLVRNPAATVAIWTPIKDLATFDDFLGRLRTPRAARRSWRRRCVCGPSPIPCASTAAPWSVVNPTPGLEGGAGAAARWIAAVLGEPGADGRADMIRG